MILLSPMVPIAYVSIDTDSDDYNADRGLEGEYLFPAQMLAAADFLDAEGEDSDDDDDEVYEATYGNYDLVDDLFFALMWINLSIIMLLSMSMLPSIGKIFFLAWSIEYFVSSTYDYSSDFLNNNVRLLTGSIR